MIIAMHHQRVAVLHVRQEPKVLSDALEVGGAEVPSLRLNKPTVSRMSSNMTHLRNTSK